MDLKEIVSVIRDIKVDFIEIPPKGQFTPSEFADIVEGDVEDLISDSHEDGREVGLGEGYNDGYEDGLEQGGE